jgi:cytoskeleton-associated protein 5
LKSLTEPLGALLEDGYEGARNEAAVCLGTLMKMVGERPLNALMESLADVRKAKVKEAYEKATVKCKVGASAPPKAPAPARDASAKKKVPASKSTPATMTAGDDESSPKKTLAKPPAKLVRRSHNAPS